MNDFTKEELIWLEEEIRLDIDEYQQPEIAYQVHDKIQSMIDNYCDHEEKETVRASCISTVYWNKCMKCGGVV